MKAQKAVVAGGAGFIGTYVVQVFLDNGWRVSVLDRHPVQVNRQRYESQRLEMVVADFADTDRLLRCCAGADAIVHLAHSTVPATAADHACLDITDAILPTVRFLSRLPSQHIRRLVYISSGGTIYGPSHDTPIRESHPTEPISVYGIAKLAIEQYVRLYASLKGFGSAILRPSNAYGPGQDLSRPQGAVAIFLDRICQNQPVEIFGDGSIVRDYLHVIDLASAIYLAASSELSGVWNIGTGRGSSISGLIELLQSAASKRAVVHYLPPRAFDVPVNVLDIAQVQKDLGWTPTVRLEAGIKNLYQAYSRNEWHLRWHCPWVSS